MAFVCEQRLDIFLVEQIVVQLGINIFFRDGRFVGDLGLHRYA